MGQKVVTTYTDDLDGSKGAQTIRFGLDGRIYEIDLSKRNEAALNKVLKPYIEAGRKVGRTGAKPTGTKRTASTSAIKIDPAKVRKWAKDNGYDVAARGRISVDVVAAFMAAN